MIAVLGLGTDTPGDLSHIIPGHDIDTVPWVDLRYSIILVINPLPIVAVGLAQLSQLLQIQVLRAQHLLSLFATLVHLSAPLRFPTPVPLSTPAAISALFLISAPSFEVPTLS